MCALGVVTVDPCIHIRLRLLERPVEPFAKRHLIELLQHRFVEPLADAVRMGVTSFGFRVRRHIPFID